MDFTLFMPVQVFSGVQCVRRHGEVLRTLGKRCLIVTGGHSAQTSGALEELGAVLAQQGIDYAPCPAMGANPRLSQCRQAAEAAQAWDADFLVGIGGGSVMDGAKAAAWLAANRPDDTEALMAGKLRRPPLPLVLIGTSAGTGSEVSAVSVLTRDDTGRKQSLTHPHCYARYVFADPRYTHSLPREQTVSTALDAFCHAAEGWFSPACGDVVTAFDERALPLVAGGLAWLAAHDGLPDEDMRERLYYGSLWAGMVLNACGTAFPHPLGYVLTEDFGIPHGQACAAFLPAFLQRAETHSPARAQALYTLCGGREVLLSSIAALAAAPGVRMDAARVAGYAARWTPSPKNFDRTPGGFTAEDAAQLLDNLFGG